MIKLNLLPETYKNRYKIKAKRLGLILVILTIFAAVFMWTFYSYLELKQKEVEYKNLLSEYNIVDKKAKDAEEIKKEVDKYKQEILFFVKLVENQPLVSRVLNDLGTYIPDDVWLIGFNYAKNKGFLIKGYALSGLSPAKFVDNLSRSTYFREIKLEDTQKDGDVYTFSITGKFSFE